MSDEHPGITRYAFFTAFFAINFLVGLGGIISGAYAIGMSLVGIEVATHLLIGGLAVFIPSLLIMFAEWVGWKRKNSVALTILSIVCFVLALPFIVLTLFLPVEAVQKGWHVSHTIFVIGGPVVGCYLVTCGVYRLRFKKRLKQAGHSKQTGPAS